MKLIQENYGLFTFVKFVKPNGRQQQDATVTTVLALLTLRGN